MRIYPEELEGEKKYWSDPSHPRSEFPYLTPDQIEIINSKARGYEKWMMKHLRLHNLIGIVTMLYLLDMQLYALTTVASFLRSVFHYDFIVITLVSTVYGFFVYGFVVYTMHEGAGHNSIVRSHSSMHPLEQKFWNLISSLVRNACRLFFADPDHYFSAHPSHHRYLGTEKDGAYTNFVYPKRFFTSLIPLAGSLPFNDYKIHDGDVWTKSKVKSTLIGLFYSMLLIGLTGIIGMISNALSLGQAAFVVLLSGGWIGFVLDRLRETSEHNLMPDNDYYSGTRNLGPGFWGLLVGGGPWGQPCHLSHHLAPNLPWYFQIRMYFDLRDILTPEQKEVFLVKPYLGYPRLFRKLIRDNIRYSK